VRTVQIYDIGANSWELGPPLPQPNNHGMAAGVNGKVYIIGGETLADDPNNYVDTVYKLDRAKGAWVEMARMSRISTAREIRSAPSVTTAPSAHCATSTPRIPASNART